MVALGAQEHMLRLHQAPRLTLDKMHQQLPPGITLVKADEFSTWLMDIQVVDSNPLYAGETYRLKFVFSSSYPIEVRDIPQHQIPSKAIRRMAQHLL